MTTLKLSEIRIDGGTQTRSHLDEDVVTEYSEALNNGAVFPPVVVFNDGSDYWMGDGFHRFHGHVKSERAEIDVDIRPGTRRAAILFAVGANQSHGLRRSNDDKRNAVMVLLDDPEWAAWSDRDIAKACGVSHTFVAATRRPGASERQKGNRLASAVKQSKQVESDSTRPTVATPIPRPEVSVAKVIQKATAESDAAMIKEAMFDFDPLVELEAANKQNAELNAQLAAIEADDPRAEVLKWKRAHEVSERRLSEVMESAHHAQKHTKFLSGQLMRCGRAVGQEDTDKIAPTVEAFVRSHSKAGAKVIL
jgi:hypothetical protein